MLGRMKNNDDDAAAASSPVSGPIFVTVPVFAWTRLWILLFASEQWDAEFSPSYPHFFGYHT